MKKLICALKNLWGLHPKSAIDHYDSAIRHGLTGEHDKALALFGMAILKDSKFARAYGGMGVSYHKKGKKEKAIECFKKAIELDPWGEAGELARKALQELARESHEAINANPDDATVRTNLGNVYYYQGKLDLAIQEYKKAVEINSDCAEAHYNLGNAYNDLGRMHQDQRNKECFFFLAIKEHKEALRIKPAYAEPHNQLGLIYKDLGKLPLAIFEWQEAKKIDQNLVEAYENLANAYIIEEKFDLAIKECEEAIKINPNYIRGYYTLGVAYEKSRRYQEAMKAYQEFIKVVPPDDAKYASCLKYAKKRVFLLRFAWRKAKYGGKSGSDRCL